MKKAFIFILPVMLFLSSCEKDKVESFALSDKWKLVMSCGGVVGCLPASNITTIEFKGDEIIEQVKASESSPPTYYKSSTYTTLDVTYEDSKATYKVKLEDGTVYMIDVFADSLVLSDELLSKTYHKL